MGCMGRGTRCMHTGGACGPRKAALCTLCLKLVVSPIVPTSPAYPEFSRCILTHPCMRMHAQVFYRMGLNDKEIVVLSGGHTLGRARPERSGFGEWPLGHACCTVMRSLCS